jgi:hypothetical protein
MPRNLTTERQTYICLADACQQGRSACPVPTACEKPEDRSYMLAHLVIAVILVGVIAGLVFGVL